MSRITLAFSCFFRLLFGAKLPERAADYLPERARPALPEAKDTAKADQANRPAEQPKPKAEPDAEPKPDSDAAKSETKLDPPRSERKSGNQAESHEDGALALLALLQREGRLIDFLREDLSEYEDDEIGASVRDIHRGCKQVIDEHLELEPVMPGAEDEDVTVPKGFDPGEIRLVGDVAGQPPFKGVMRHHGWRVIKAKLPTLTEGVDRHVLAPAEVEIS
jgi:hypothetical protein